MGRLCDCLVWRTLAFRERFLQLDRESRRQGITPIRVQFGSRVRYVKSNAAELTDSNLREVVLYPTRQWGGEGLIGCGIGYAIR